MPGTTATATATAAAAAAAATAATSLATLLTPPLPLPPPLRQGATCDVGEVGVGTELDYAACCGATVNVLGFICKNPLDYLGANPAKMKVYGTNDKFHPLFGSLYYRTNPDLPHSSTGDQNSGEFRS